jgi:hypothetical protein
VRAPSTHHYLTPAPPRHRRARGPFSPIGQETSVGGGATAQVDCAGATAPGVEDAPMRECREHRPGAGPLGQRPEGTPGAGYAGPGGDRTMGGIPSSGGGLDPDRAFLVPHTAKSAGSQANASTSSARERAPQSGGVPISVDAPACNRRSACSNGACCPILRAGPIPLDLLCVRVLWMREWPLWLRPRASRPPRGQQRSTPNIRRR